MEIIKKIDAIAANTRLSVNRRLKEIKGVLALDAIMHGPEIRANISEGERIPLDCIYDVEASLYETFTSSDGGVHAWVGHHAWVLYPWEGEETWTATYGWDVLLPPRKN